MISTTAFALYVSASSSAAAAALKVGMLETIMSGTDSSPFAVAASARRFHFAAYARWLRTRSSDTLRRYGNVGTIFNCTASLPTSVFKTRFALLAWLKSPVQ